MCGIVGYTQKQNKMVHVSVLEKMMDRIAHRGPDGSGLYYDANIAIGHRRLAIIDVDGGEQPMKNEDQSIVCAFNGEIYNHKAIRAEFAGTYNFRTQSDCEVIIPLYKKCLAEGSSFAEMIEKLSGIFAFALYDSERDAYLIGRDEIGVIPLYQGWDKSGRYYVASELKALEGDCVTIEEFPNGSYLWSKDGKVERWYKRDWESYDAVKASPRATDEKGEVINPSVIEKVRNGLESAVKSHSGAATSGTSASHPILYSTLEPDIEGTLFARINDSSTPYSSEALATSSSEGTTAPLSYLLYDCRETPSILAASA